jgi:acetyl-CoA carboxylase biotin carboxyl carrier protein
MSIESIDALVLDSADGAKLGAPRPGRVRFLVGPGDLVRAGQVFAWLESLGRFRGLRIPPGVQGRVEPRPPLRIDAARGDVLLSIAPLSDDGTLAAGTSTSGDAGGWVLEAPMDGQLYQRSSPDVPPFVAPGDRVEPGQTIGLIEVMKFFYPLRFEGATGPMVLDTWLVPDACPVESGRPIARFRPLDPA